MKIHTCSTTRRLSLIFLVSGIFPVAGATVPSFHSGRIYELPEMTVTSPRQAHSPSLSHQTVVVPLEPPGPGLREALQPIPGLLLQESFGGIEPPRLSVRGSGIQSAPVSRGMDLSLNGFPLNFADGSFNLALVESGWIQHAALTPGPGAGVPALGGSLALWTAGGVFPDRRSVTGTFGSDRTGYVSTQQVHRGEFMDFSLEGAWFRTDGWRNRSSQRRESLLIATRAPVGERSEATFQFFGSRPRFDVPGPLPKAAALENPKSNIAIVEQDRPRRETEYAQMGGKVITRGTGGYFSVGFTGVWHEDEFYQLRANGVTATRGYEGSLFADARREWDTALPQKTDFNLILQSGWTDSLRHRNQFGEKGAPIGDNRLRPTTLNAGLKHAVSPVDRQTVEAGVSVLAGRRKIHERFETGPGRESTALNLSEVKPAPRLSWSLEVTETATFSLSWARSHEPPTFSDLLFTPPPPPPPPARVLQSTSLDWQRADSFEARLRGENGPVFWTTGAYYARWRNEFLRLRDETGAARGTVNADKTLHIGWESALEVRLAHAGDYQLGLWANHNWSDIRFDNDPVYGKNKLGGIPPHAGALGLRGDLPGGWFVSPGFFWQGGKAYADHANTLSFGGFGIWSLDLGREHPRGWKAVVRLTNLLDRNYIASTAGVLDEAALGPNQPIFLPGAGRRVEARLEYAW